MIVCLILKLDQVRPKKQKTKILKPKIKDREARNWSAGWTLQII